MKKTLTPFLLVLFFACTKKDTSEIRTIKTTAKVNSIDNIVNDTKLLHEGKLHGLPDSYDWSKGPRMGMGNNPGTFKAMIAWGQVYEDAQGNPATNTRVQLRNMEAWYLSKMDNKWHLVQQSQDVEGRAYVEDFVNDINKPANTRVEPDGGISVTAGDGYNFHFWTTTGRSEINPDDIKGVFVTLQARLVLEDITKADDRTTAKYLLGVGGDYWLSLTAAWDWFRTNGDIAIGRMKYVKKNWQAFNMCTLTEADLRANPPLLK
jgi:hypothetical protein